MWQNIKSSGISGETLSGKIITEYPKNPDDQFEILSIENNTVIAFHANGRNVLLAIGYEDLFSEKWWMKI